MISSEPYMNKKSNIKRFIIKHELERKEEGTTYNIGAGRNY